MSDITNSKSANEAVSPGNDPEAPAAPSQVLSSVKAAPKVKATKKKEAVAAVEEKKVENFSLDPNID